MDTFESIKLRRSAKQYDPDFLIPEEDEKALLSHALLSPTAFNIQNWRFVLVKDKELRKKIRAVSWDQAQVTEASLLIVLCADLRAWDKQPERYWVNAPQAIQDRLVPAIKGYYQGNERVMQDEAMRSCGMAAQTLMLAATALGYDTCPMDGFDFEAVGKLINLPEDHVVSMFVVIGKKVKDPWDRPGQLSYDEVVIENSF